jgi:CHAT domain-containing protein/tetratricopeptide (TPR) repeat protein
VAVRILPRRNLGLAGACLAVALCLAPVPRIAAQPADDPARLAEQIGELQNAGRYADALPLAERLVAMVKARHPEASLEYADALELLAETYFFQSRYAEAEPLYAQVIAIREKALGPGDESVLTLLDTLATLHRFNRRPQLAEPLLKRVLSERERTAGPDHPSVAKALKGLAEAQSAAQHYDDAERHIRRAIAITRKAGTSPSETAQLLSTLAQIELSQGRLQDAERSLKEALSLHDEAARAGPQTPDARLIHMFALMQLSGLFQQSDRYKEAGVLAERVLSVTEEVLGPDHPNVAAQLEVLATMYALQGRLADAEAPRKRALAINERAYGPEHQSVGGSLQGLGHLYRLQQRNDEALPLLLRGLAIAEKTLGSDHPTLSVHLSEIAGLYHVQRRYAEAEPLLERALANLDRAQGVDPVVAGAQTIQILQSLAFLHQSQRRQEPTRRFLERALAVSERVFGPEHSMTAGLLTSLAMNRLDQEQVEEAQRLFERALPLSERLGRDDTDYAGNIAGLAMVHFKRNDWASAYAAMKQASAIYIAAEQRLAAGAARRGVAPNVIRYADMYLVQAATAFRLAEADRAAEDGLREESFQIVQRAESSQAAAALGQMAARFSSGTGELATLVRERQDLANEWQAQDARLTAQFAALPGQRNPDRERALRDQLAAIATRLDGLDARLAREFPAYAGLARPRPLSTGEARALLAPGEALVVVATLLNQSLVWVVTGEAVQWDLVPLGEVELAREVAALRCGLDASAWEMEGESSCRSLLGTLRQPGEPLPFDLARAHALYLGLLAPFQQTIKGKQLLIAASGPLTALPFSVLVTEKPDAPVPADPRRYADAAWLAKSHATTMLPSVASLASLRGVARPAAAASPFIGFGNPLLTGRDGWDRSAWSKQHCARDRDGPPAHIASRAAPQIDAALVRGSAGSTEALRRQSPLPETADELCAVARDLGAADRDVVLGSRATETAVKALSDEGRLATYRVLHFATHGLLAGETESFGFGAEPALLLTPPERVTPADDGLLTASEVASLKLNADWVVLSACNTAGGAKAGAQPLSGLARAFFYAGARALLVSHWYVDSDAAVKLVTGIFAQDRREATAGRAEAVRRAILRLIGDTSRPAGWTPAAHPSVWAPFVVVGEGGAAR